MVGVDALRLARAEPGRLEPRPKSRIADSEVLLGDAEVLLGDAVVPTTTLVRPSCPGSWPRRRRPPEHRYST